MQDKLRPPALFNFAYPGTGLLVLFSFLEFRFIDYFFYISCSKFVCTLNMYAAAKLQEWVCFQIVYLCLLLFLQEID